MIFDVSKLPTQRRCPLSTSEPGELPSKRGIANNYLDSLNLKTNLDRNSQRWRNVPAQQDPDDHGRECLRSYFPEAQLAR